jgi:hypothetical protein
MSLDDIFNLIRYYGQGCFIIKRDIKEAFCNVPLAPEVCPLLAFAWERVIYVECCLPFGLAIAA